MADSNPDTDSDAGLEYEDVLDEFTRVFKMNYEGNADPTGMGVESENPIVREEDGVMPLASDYQDIISEELWESIEKELEKNVDGYGEEFSFELKDVKEKGHFEDRPAEIEVEQDQESDQVMGAPAGDWEIGPQLEIDSGAFQIDGSGNFGTLLDVLKSLREGTRKYIEENHPNLEFAEQGLTRQFREPEETPDEIGDREVITRGVGDEYGRDEAVEFSEEFYDHFSSVEYCADYISTIFGPQITENMFGGSTQLTSGLWNEDDDIDIDDRMTEEMAYRIIFEGAFDVLTSSIYLDEEGEHETGVNQDYWENSAYGQHFLDNADVDEDALDRTGTPWNVIGSMMDSEQDSFQGMVDEYMTGHSMAWIAKPDREYVEFEQEVSVNFDYESVVMLTVDPENPKTPRKYIEDGEVDFTKIVTEEEDGLQRVNGKIDLSGMHKDELKEYHKGNFAEQHIGGMHHDVRPKFQTGGFEYRNSRQNYEDEPSVALAKAAIMPHGNKIRETMEDYGIDPSDPETVPDYDDEVWRDVFSDVYDDEVMETAKSMAPTYANDFQDYVEQRLSGPEARNSNGSEPV